MSGASSKQHRQILEDALSKAIVTKVWSANVESIMPLTFNDVDLQAVMPAVLYTLRWGGRRGGGRFIESFASNGARDVKPLDVARKVLDRQRASGRFVCDQDISDDEQSSTIANLFSGLCFDNRKSIPGIEQPIQRVYPVHYLSSKFDLPGEVAHLRGVPEYVVGILTSIGTHKTVDATDGLLHSLDQRFNSGSVLHLLRLYASAVRVCDEDEKRAANLGNPNEVIDEAAAAGLGIDQLLLMRASECIDYFPPRQKNSGGGYKPPISITERQNLIFEHDLRDFLRFYGSDLPRNKLNRSLEVLIGLNLFASLLSFSRIMHVWFDKGELLNVDEQRPYGILIDCSKGEDRDIRRFAEQTYGEALRRYVATTIPIKAYQILTRAAEIDRRAEFPPLSGSDPRRLLEAAGDIFHRNRGGRVMERLRDDVEELYAALTESDDDTLLAASLDVDGSPVASLARVIVEMMGSKVLDQNMVNLLDSCLGANDNGRGTSMVAKRNSQRSRGGLTRAYSLERSFRLPDIVIETLAHRLLIHPDRGVVRRLTVREFIDELAERYGLCIDHGEGMKVPADVFRRNREYLEERLRSLSLLEGVNDAENMKVLQPRYRLSDGYQTLRSGGAH
ncbi:MAG: hypothetical protein JRN15_11330 [Nitrososphaerota archaeon]|nr:hypothetical protein [Nitrososphaerota archaeon]